MRELWQGHAETTREYALAVKAGDAAAEKKSADAVVANAKKIADAVGSFYGDAAGKKMLELLAGHWGGGQGADRCAEEPATPRGVTKAMQDLAANADDDREVPVGRESESARKRGERPCSSPTRAIISS